MPERDPTDEDERHAERGERGGRIRRLGRRFLGEPDRSVDRGERADREERPERSILGEAREVFGAVLEGSDKAKSEVVRAVAREVRNYLEELGLKDDLHNLLTNYSLEVHASVNLRRLTELEKSPREERGRASRREERREEPPKEERAKEDRSRDTGEETGE